MKLLNLGCGPTYHPAWTNVDFISTGAEVIAHDLLTGIPFSDLSYDVVYHSHVLEHFSRKDAHHFIGQCHRVLKHGGLIRIAVPDLEGIARCYLEKLEACDEGRISESADYDWLMLELYDQAVRSESGGEMARFLRNLDEETREFVRARIGAEADKFWTAGQRTMNKGRLVGLVRRLLSVGLFKRVRLSLAAWLVFLVAGNAAKKSFRIGLFRSSGEVHQWMYDRYSLRRLLEQAGFVDVKVCAAVESRIPDFGKYALDVSNGAVRKPDSIFIEAVKP